MQIIFKIGITGYYGGYFLLFAFYDVNTCLGFHVILFVSLLSKIMISHALLFLALALHTVTDP